MPLLSSPVAYPRSSLPSVIPEKRKSHPFSPPPDPKRRPLRVDDGASNRGPPFRTLPLDTCSWRRVKMPEQHKAIVPAKGPFLDDDEDSDDGEKQNGETDEAVAFDSSNLDLSEYAPRAKDTAAESVDWQERMGAPRVKTSSGNWFRVYRKPVQPSTSYEQLVASRSTTTPGSASKSFYGVDIHALLDQVAKDSRPANSNSILDNGAAVQSVEPPAPSKGFREDRTMLWTEKYRARRFTDLVGDERTHRDVLRWLKGWDSVVFPGCSKLTIKPKFLDSEGEPQQHRKILLLTGPPGLGKTTLAHVCARQAGYEVVEINASDERSRDVVKGRIRDCVGTENVKGVSSKQGGKIARKAGRPVCVVVDEVDGVVSGSSGGGEGGFIKALIDLAMLDQKASNILGATSVNPVKSKKRSGRFRLLRPIILICNDVYHPALRPLRSSTMAEIVHIRKPPLDKVAARLKYVFDREGVACDGDGVRRLCEAAWGINDRRDNRANSCGTGEGDMRGILVVGEWVAAKMRACMEKTTRLSKKWVEEHIIEDFSYGGGGARGLGRGDAKEAVERTFLDGAGFARIVPVPAMGNLDKVRDCDAVGVSEPAKRAAMDRLREVVDASGEIDRIVTDCFATYPARSWQDDTFLSKPNAAYEWLQFHDAVSSKVHVGQEWELAPYLSQSVLGFHNLFACPAKQSRAGDQRRWDDNNEEEPLAFSGPRADFSASEALKQHKAVLQSLQSSLSIPLHRSFKSTDDISTDLLPHLIRMLTPDIKLTVIGGTGDQRGVVSVRKAGEREMIQHAVNVMGAVGVTFERARVESNQNGMSSYIYRMEPPLDSLATFETGAQGGPTAPARYAIRQALDQEYRKYLRCHNADARQARYKAGAGLESDPLEAHNYVDNKRSEADAGSRSTTAKRDFFGRIIDDVRPGSKDGPCSDPQAENVDEQREDRKVWVSFHEGFSNAVRKPIALEELVRGF